MTTIVVRPKAAQYTTHCTAHRLKRKEIDGFVEEIALDRAATLNQIDPAYLRADLVDIAKRESIPANGAKALLLERSFDARLLKAQKAICPIKRFKTLIVALVDVYLNDIRTNTDHFHPLHLRSSDGGSSGVKDPMKSTPIKATFLHRNV